MGTAKARGFIDWIIDQWWLVYSISLIWFLLWVAFATLGPKKPLPADENIFYPGITIVWNLLLEIPLIGFGIGCVLFAFNKKSVKAPFVLAVSTLFCVFAILWWIGPMIGPIQNGFEPDPTLTPMDSLRANNHVYNLVTHQADHMALGKAYILYECDSLDIICRAVYRYKPKSLDEVYAEFDHPPFISLVENGIAVHIAGEVVYIHPI